MYRPSVGAMAAFSVVVFVGGIWAAVDPSTNTVFRSEITVRVIGVGGIVSGAWMLAYFGRLLVLSASVLEFETEGVTTRCSGLRTIWIPWDDIERATYREVSLNLHRRSGRVVRIARSAVQRDSRKSTSKELFDDFTAARDAFGQQ